jgi:hypothetical protein
VTPTRFDGQSDEEVIDGAFRGADLEMMRRLKDAIVAQERSSAVLGRRIWWLNLWLLVFTVMICILTGVLVAEALGYLHWLGRQ